MCKRASKIYLETIQAPRLDQKYDGIGVFCGWCGKIGETDILIKINSIRLNTPISIKNNKEKIRKELDEAHAWWTDHNDFCK